MSEPITCINGEFLLGRQASVPVTNRGFRFGDGLFETIRLEHGVPYQWELHLARLHEGLAALRIPSPQVDWAKTARELITRNHAIDGFLRLAVTRGNHSTGYMPQANEPAFWVMEYLPTRPLPEKPFTLWQSSITRAPLSALPVNQKLAQGIGSTLALLEAQDHNCDEALQLTSNGLICSTASANIFWIKNRTLFTPSLATGCLNGTTRHTVLRLSPVPIHEIEADISALDTADGCFLTNTRFGIWPVFTLQPVGLNFNPNHPLIAELQQQLMADRAANIKENSANWRNS